MLNGTYRVLADEVPLGDHVGRASTFAQRLRGLLGHERLEDGEGLWLNPGASVHTLGMRFPIDVVFLDRAHRVLGVRRNVQPNRMCRAPWHTRSTLELHAGACARLGIEPGQALTFEAHRDE